MMRKWASRKGPSYPVLIALFLFFFIVPVLTLGPVVRSLFFSETVITAQPADNFIATAINIAGRGAFLKVPDATQLVPRAGEDFLAIAWLKIQDLPKQGQRMFLMSRFDAESGKKGGYAVALSRVLESMRPELYWSDEHGHGGWYTFSDVSILPGEWFMVALTYYTDHHLGVFVGSYEADGRYRLQNAGGYYLNQSVVPVNTFPLKVGSVKTGLFSGSVGPVGVFSKPDLHTDLKRILKNLIKEPSSLPTVLEEKNVIFWSPDGKSDIGPQNHEIRLVEPIKLKSNEIKG